MTISKIEIEKFFDRYAATFREGLNGSLDPEDLRALYSTQFIGAGPDGVRTGDNDEAFGEQMAKGYDNYRQIGTKAMTVTEIEVYQIDATHCLTRVSWNSAFEKDGMKIDVPFDNTYLLEQKDDALKVFAWITGDEVQLLKDNGLM